MATLMMRPIKAVLELTAAKDTVLDVENLPMTTKSAALNTSCKIPDNAKGNATAAILPRSAPCVMSISLPHTLFRFISIL